MAENQFNQLGRELGETVQEALKTGDYSKVKETVGRTVRTVVDYTTSQMPHTPRKQVPPPIYRPSYQRQNAPGYRPNRSTVGNQQNVIPYRKVNHAPSTSGPGLKLGFGLPIAIAGGLGLLSCLPNILIRLSLMSLSFVQSLLFSIALLGLGLWMAISGWAGVKRVRRYRCYAQCLSARRYALVEELARAVGKSPQFVIKDLKKMIRKGWFPEGHLDQEETSFMLGEELYRQYLAAEEAKRQRDLLEAVKRENPEGVEAVVSEGREYVQKIRRINDELPEKVISAKLNRLEIVVAKIFNHIELNPEKLPEIRRFMNYYLPTTLKLVDSYREFERQPVQVENIITAKNEISQTLDMINTAFETLLDDLYQDDTLDISTDISALKTVLAQDGLVDHKMNQKPQ